MIARLVLATLLAGLFAGLVYGGVLHVRTTPLILAAEAYENIKDHSHAENTAAHEHDISEWAPKDGWERTLATTLTAALTAVGFSLALLGISLLSGLKITRENGIIWGLCGFLAVGLAPAAGLSPELPGMPAAEILDRQIWWVATVVATSVGIYIFASTRKLVFLLGAVLIVVTPHIIGAPHLPSAETAVPALLAAEFVANSLATSAVLWCLIGFFLGVVIPRVSKEVYES